VGLAVLKAQTKDADNKPLVIKTGTRGWQPTQRYRVRSRHRQGRRNALEPDALGRAHLEYRDCRMAAGPDRRAVVRVESDGRRLAPFLTSATTSRAIKRATRAIGFCRSLRRSRRRRTTPRARSRCRPRTSRRAITFRSLAALPATTRRRIPGVYLNHSMVALAGYGAEITSGPDPTAAGFGAGVAAPVGMSTVPVAQPAHGRPRRRCAAPGRCRCPAAARRSCAGAGRAECGHPLAAGRSGCANSSPGWSGRDGEGGRRCHVVDMLAANGWTEALARQHGMIV
jgi:hypothetical protein